MIESSFGAPVITSFVTVERSTFSGSAGLFSVGMGRPMPGHARAVEGAGLTGFRYEG
ncbi:hypothetical protein D3C71_1915520 [compost metagenome]